FTLALSCFYNYTPNTQISSLSLPDALPISKRLVELGHDVVVLLDNITRLGRAYNLAAPASGRILSGGVDSTALYPPKRFLGAARDRKSTRLNSSHVKISYAVFCLKKKIRDI